MSEEKKWRASTDNSASSKPWFVYDGTGQQHNYYRNKKGHIVRFANYTGAQRKADQLNREASK
jgi:hypothetical protein